MSKEKLTPQDRYAKKNTKVYSVRVVKTTEADIYNKLSKVENASGYIKSLIRRDIKEGSL